MKTVKLFSNVTIGFGQIGVKWIKTTAPARVSL